MDHTIDHTIDQIIAINEYLADYCSAPNILTNTGVIRHYIRKDTPLAIIDTVKAIANMHSLNIHVFDVVNSSDIVISTWPKQ